MNPAAVTASGRAPAAMDVRRAILSRLTEIREQTRRYGLLADPDRLLAHLGEEIEEIFAADAAELLTLDEAAGRSGYSRDHIARLVRDGAIPNAGSKGRPAVRTGDLPRRAPGKVERSRRAPYDPSADARALGSRR